MTLKIKILILLVCLFPWMRTLADPVVTTVGSGSICPETEIVIPVTVSNCNGVAAISLALNFDNTRVSYQGYQNVNNSVSTMLVNQSNGTIYMTWANMSAVNLGDGTLVELRFNSTDVSGNANLNWNTSMCEYSDVTGTALQASYYNGSVTVYGMPTITSNPSNLSLTEGQNSYFQVGASGQGVTYQWQVKTPVDNTWRDVIADSHHSNVNSYRLYVNDVTLEMDGNQYRCVVSGTCPSPVISRTATLSVASYIQTIVTSLGSVNTCFDQVFSIPVNVTNCNNVGSISLVMNYDANLVTYIGYENANSELSNGFMRVNAASGRVYFTWATSNQALQLGNGQLISFAFRSAAGNSNLTWNTSQCEYTNLVGNPLPASYNGSTLYINYPPSITSHPSNQTVMEGANTSFSITASGNSLSYQWQMSQDQGISWETLSNGTHYSSVTSRTLYVNNVVASMDGYRYRCLVNGSCDPAATSNYATLYVETQMSNVVTTAGSLNTCSQNEFGIPISVTGCNHVGAISLALSYNTNVLTYTGYEGVNPALSNGQLQVNAINGTVFIAWASIDGANVGNGNLLTLNFTALSGTSSLSWNTRYCEYANTQGVPFPATYQNGSVTVGDMSFTITSQPMDQIVTMEENASFSVATSGPTSGFQWQVSQDHGSSWSNVVAGDHYATPNTNTLTINNVSLEMDGYRFRCRISGDCGYQYTSVATLTVQLPPNHYQVSLTADPEEGGTMEGAGAYTENTSCTVTAVPATGYDFVNWTEGGTEVSTNAAYTFIVTANRDLVAHFTLQEISINVSANPIGGGTINGGGTYLYGEYVLLTAIPITGSVFDNWTEDGEVISTNQSISFTAQTDRTLVANFSVQQVNITATPVPASNGSVEGAGTYAYGSTVTLVAHAEQGFQLSTWTENGEVVGTSDTLSFMAENDRNMEANFITQQLHITAVADPEIGGIITGAGTYNYGDPVVLTATPIGNSEFLFWKEDGVIVSDQPTYNFNAYEHRNLVAHFYVTVTIAATAQPEGSGEISGTGTYNYTASVTLTASPTTGFSFANWMESDTLYATTTSISFTAYTDRNFVVNFDTIMHHVNVSVNLAEAGTVTGSGDYQEGSLAFVSAVPNEHYEFVSWTENGVTVSSNPNYTFAVWGDRNLVANFSLVSFYVTATANPANGGEITGTGEYYYGDPCTLTATPNQGYFFENWTQNDSVVSTTQTYSFIVTEDATYEANFDWTNPASTDYISDGLIMYLDGIYNTRNGHSTTTDVWEDLMGNYDLTVSNYSSYAWEDNHFIGFGNGGYLNTGKTWKYFNSLNNDLTIEIVTFIDCDKTSPSYRGLAGEHAYNDGTNFQNDQGGSRMQTLGALPVTEADDQIATVSYTLNNGSFLNGVWKIDDQRIYLGINSDYNVVFGNSLRSRGWNDSIYCIRMYNRSLTPEEIAYNHSIDIERFGAGFPVIDTTIYAEICYGEDYLQNGFEIYYPEVGENQYSITLPSAQGNDSIVNLLLTVYPVYFFAEDTTLCNATSYIWRGNTYTESGIYYDSLQTVHGCDSIYQLSLELFNTPLGEFTYMTPTNNYPFTSLPITFSWDAVSGAEYYDLYVWDAEEQESEEPLASGLRYGSYSTSALQNYHTYNWFVKARNACYEMSSSVKSFYLDITPSLNVNVNHIDFGEVAMNQSTSTTVNVTGIVLEDELDVQITGEDAAMFSFTQASGWNDYNGGILIVTFNPTTPQYVYNANLVVSSGTLTKTVSLIGAVSNLYTFNTYVAEDVYAMNTQIPIYGSVVDWNNAPVEDAEVEIGVFVMGMKRTLQATTDANGQFSAVFDPMPSESGYYTVNSGRVGNHSTAVHDDFNIPGMALVTSDYILCAVTQDQPKTDSILIRNKSNLPLNNIQLQTLSAPEGCAFSFSPMSLGGLEEDYLVYTVTGSTLTQGNYYEEVRLKATSNEGAETVITVWYYCMEPRGVLDVLPKALTTTMTKGKSKIVDVMLTNNGTAATGNITIDLPDVDWMSVVGNDILSSIAVNDTAYFSLRFSPAEDIQLGQYSGTIAINSERGDAVALPYTITAVSDSTGTLMIDVTDDFTWNTNNGNGPHLEGAEVTLKGYYSLETVASGFTDADGHFSVEDLPEGYYRLSVTAERHTDYNSVVFVEAGATGRSYTDVYLQYQAVTYSWTVEPTEIPDEYTYELNVVYETHVPVPVITIEHSGIHDLEYGESANFNLVITNHGLISAFDTHIYFTESSEYTFVPLYDIIDTLQALTTIVIPGTYYRTGNRMRSSDGDCDVHCLSVSVYYCNMNGGWSPLFGRSKPFPIGSFEICRPDGNGGGGFPGMNVPNLYGGPFEKKTEHNEKESTPNMEKEFCTPCIQKLASALAGCIKKNSLASCLIINGLNDFNSALVQGSLPQWEKFLFDEVSCLFKGTFGKIFGIAMCLKSVAEISECVKIEIHDQVNNNSRDNMGNIQNTIDGLYYSSLYYSNEFEFVESFFPGEVWETEENISEFFSEFTSLTDSVTGFVPESAADSFASSFIGTSVTYDDIINFVNRWNRSFEYWSNGYLMVSDLPIGYDTNFIQIDTCMINYMIEIEDYYTSIGYENMNEVYEESVQNATIIEENASQSSICASVTVKFSQKMTMTREAFDGTFTVHNGHDTEPMEAIGLEFLIKDEDGYDCTNLFQINTTLLNNITGIDGDGSLDAGLDGVAKIMFIPTKNAAPTEPKLYYFGGTFSFIDPYTSEEIVYDLYPVEITVNPSPDLYVDYFMQRDILGDDALTTDVIEPTVPAELGVIIHNQGAGIAKNVILETAEPEIIDNEKGLAIDFAMYGASFNGSPRQLGLKSILFGNIGSGQTAVGEWLFTSSLLGHFVSYEANVIHNSSYGNQDLSLVSHLDIHELIHPIYAYGNLDDGINDFLVNDNPDAYDTPDSIYFSHGGKTSVGVVDGISFDHLVSPSDTIVTLTVVPSRVGWNYGVTDDPGMNQYNIVSCIRNNDNQVIPLNNVWLTFVTIPDGGDPVYENKLHIVDTILVQQTTTYTLVFAKKPSNLRIFHGNEDEYWSNVANWEGYILPQANDEVLINGICELDEDAEVFSLTVAENKSLTIPDGRILTVSGSLTNADASGLVIEEGGQLMHTNTGAQGTVEKNILPYTEGTKDGGYLVSSPLAGFTNVTSVSDLLSNNYDLYYYDEPTHYWINQEYAANNFTELTNGKGYLYANNEEVMLGFEGELQSGSAIINVLLNYTDGIDLAGFNLVGNPYAHNVTSYASVNVANGCYQLNETKDDFIVSEISEENPLHPAEGFFVKATDEGASITFNSGRGAKANPGGSIRVELVENGKLIDRLIVKLEGEPLRKLSLNEIRTKVYATQDHQEVAIVNCTGNEQPINFKASKNGEYTLNVNTNGTEFNYLHLIDNLTGADVDLLALRQAQGPMSYTFEAKTTDYASRFRLVFSICGDANGDNGDDAPFAFISNGNIIIVGADAHAVLQVVDVMGRVLVSRKGDAMNALSTSGMAKGVYVLRLIEGDKVRTQKLVID